MKIRMALIKNPKIPLTITMKYINNLRDNDIKDLMRDRNVPAAVAGYAKRLLEKKTAPKKEEGH
jgi:ribosomal protein L12E/L44/L45/RPP1/RPP2